MTDVLDSAPIIKAAQQAAAAGDYSEAERLLREAAAKQERSLGPLHPDLASTLNNLALVCERTNKLDEAERGYRRAHAIAVASLSPGHPFVTTSLKNLVDFCAAHGIPMWKPPAPASEDAISSPEPVAAVSPEPQAEAPPEPQAAAPPELQAAAPPELQANAPPEPVVPAYTPSRTLRPRTIAVVTLGVAVIVAVALGVQRRGTTDTSDPVPQALNKPSANDSPPTSATTPALIGKAEPTVTPEKRADTTPAPVERPKPFETNTTPASVSVLNAQLCSALEREGSPDWQCAPVNGDLPPGRYSFYTRLLTNVDTTVEHRWYRGERVQLVRRLSVTASPGRGYRTFSSNTVSAERAGDWKVELRGADGTVLWEKQFVIR